MDQRVKEAIFRAVEKESFAQSLHMELVALERGYSAVEMTHNPATMNNIYDMAHGGVIYTLIDEAFETAGQTDGTVALALNVSVTYVSTPETGTRLRAEAREVSRTKKTIGYDIRVTDRKGQLIATCHALGYRTGKPIPFLSEE